MKTASMQNGGNLIGEVMTKIERLAREAQPVLIEKDGCLYRVEATIEDSGQPRHDPERVRRILARTAGAFRGVDGEALKRDIKAARVQASKGRPA